MPLKITHPEKPTEQDKIDDDDYMLPHSISGYLPFSMLGGIPLNFGLIRIKELKPVSNITMTKNTIYDLVSQTIELTEETTIFLLAKSLFKTTQSSPWWIESWIYKDDDILDHVFEWDGGSQTYHSTVNTALVTLPSGTHDLILKGKIYDVNGICYSADTKFYIIELLKQDLT